ncbi:MAG: c-type cytochrome [Myxococcales bacterium]|nr:c-type cytochrome [Myxococcales bacterium]MDH5305543.1 c-type cytochrome [Myxococcales bacterium]MDH5565216.1 c-type cytochrome [Myxococcales bacterium]
MRRWTPGAALVASLAMAHVSPAFARPDVPDEIASKPNPAVLDGDEVRYYERQYRGKCARCHGADGSGGGEEAAAQAVPPANFTDAAFMASRSDGQFFYQILMGGGTRCAMPAFGPESDSGWSEEKIWHMVAFVRRFAATPAH